MSCFKGKMLEYRNVSLDRFDGHNLQSTAYFLSHCHEDHTVGLSSPSFYERISSRTDIFVYCSKVTMILLKENPKYQHLTKYIKPLPVDEPVSLPIPHQQSDKVDIVVVTLLHAGHCPGSVMFLMEGSEGTVLYTGDFRWETDKISGISALHVGESVKPVRSVYIDTTFCHPDSFYIPPRHESIEAVCMMVKEWMAQGPNNVVHFRPRSNYGHEPLLKEVARKTGHSIHTDRRKVQIYEQIAELSGMFTSDPMATPIHACSGFASREELPCKYQADHKDKMKLMIILPSTMYFTQQLRLNHENIIVKDKGIYRVCYSFHSSLAEVRDLVTYLHPDRVRPNVKPVGDDNLSFVQKRLNGFLELKHCAVVKKEKERPLGLLRSIKRKKTRIKPSVSSDSEGLIFSSGEEKLTKKRKISPKDKHSSPDDVSDLIQKAYENDSNDDNSSYAGSNRSDSELSGICEDDSDEENWESKSTLSTPRQSLLEAINSQCEDDQSESLSCRVCRFDDVEQTLEEAIPTDELPELNEDIEGQNGVKDIEKGQGDSTLCDTSHGDMSSHCKSRGMEGDLKTETKCVISVQSSTDDVHERGHGKVKDTNEGQTDSCCDKENQEKISNESDSEINDTSSKTGALHSNSIEKMGAKHELGMQDKSPPATVAEYRICPSASLSENGQSKEGKSKKRNRSPIQKRESFDLFDEESSQSDFCGFVDKSGHMTSQECNMDNVEECEKQSESSDSGTSQGFIVMATSHDQRDEFDSSISCMATDAFKCDNESNKSSDNKSLHFVPDGESVVIQKEADPILKKKSSQKAAHDIDLLFECDDSCEENQFHSESYGDVNIRKSPPLLCVNKSVSDIDEIKTTSEIDVSSGNSVLTTSPISSRENNLKSDSYESDSDITLPPSQGSLLGNRMSVLLSPQKSMSKPIKGKASVELENEIDNVIVISDETEYSLDSSSGSRSNVDGVVDVSKSDRKGQSGQNLDHDSSSSSSGSPRKLVQWTLSGFYSPVKRSAGVLKDGDSSAKRVKQSGSKGGDKWLNSGHKHIVLLDTQEPEIAADTVIDLTTSDEENSQQS